MTHLKYSGLIAAAGLAAGVAHAGGPNFTTDVTVQGSMCVGFDCTTSESFGFDTIRIKENNTRLTFVDTSTTASFPGNDWEIQANESSNGGKNWLAFRDTTNNKTAFTIEANAQANTLYVEEDGDVGIKTNEPAVDLHIVEGNSPTLRLEQDGSDGFASQTWDLSGNEANFFLRDVTNGSKLPFRVKPNAPTDSLFIAADGDTGFGTDSPEAPIHIKKNVADNEPHLLIEATQSSPTVGRAEIWFEDANTTADGDALRLQLNEDVFNVTFNGTGGSEFSIAKTGVVSVLRGNLVVDNNQDLVVDGGSVIVGGTTLNVPDYVFAPDYELMPLEEVGAFIAENSHLPHIPSAAEINAGQLDMVSMQLAMLKTIEELTLYTLEQNEINAAQADLIETLEERLNGLSVE